MRMTKITEKNFMWIASKLKKFFDHGDVITWHNYNFGGKRHIQKDFYLNGMKVAPIQRYDTAFIQIVTPKIIPSLNTYMMQLCLNPENMGMISIGDYVSFHGNRIHITSDASVYMGPGVVCYEVYQLWDPNGGFKDIEPECSYQQCDWF